MKGEKKTENENEYKRTAVAAAAIEEKENVATQARASTSNMPNQSIEQRRRPKLCGAQRAGEVFLFGTRVDSIQINFPWKQYQ